MPTDGEWLDAQNAIERHEEAVTEDARKIAELQAELKLIKEAFILSHDLKYKASPLSQAGHDYMRRVEEILRAFRSQMQ